MHLNESYPGIERLDERVTLLNPIYGSICAGAKESMLELDDQTKRMVVSSVNKLTERYNESLFMTNTTARAALLGRQMPIVDKMRKLATTFGLEAKVPDALPNGEFGYVALTNDTWSGPFEIYTGYQVTASSLGELISYRGKRRLTTYQGRCNRLQASVGELRPMPIDHTRLLEMFSPNFCRIIHLKPTGLHKIREGMAISYIVAPEDFMSADLNPDNRCFCTNGTYDNHCSLNGVIELAPCAFGSPLLVAVSNIGLDSKITNTIKDWDPEIIRGDVDTLGPSDDMKQILILKRIGVPLMADLTATMFMKISRDPDFR